MTAGTLVEHAHDGGGAQPGRVREELEDHFPERPVSGAAPVVALQLRADRFDQLVVLHAGWARRHTSHAPQARVEVLDIGVVERDRAFLAELHQVDASARGVHLLAPQRIRRAGGQAEAAVHTVGYPFIGRRVVCVEDAEKVC